MKLTFDEALNRVCEERHVHRDQVRASALKRKLWIAEWHIPGCISESSMICMTKQHAINAACLMAEGESGAPRGMKRHLNEYGQFISESPMFGRVINTIRQTTLGDML